MDRLSPERLKELSGPHLLRELTAQGIRLRTDGLNGLEVVSVKEHSELVTSKEFLVVLRCKKRELLALVRALERGGFFFVAQRSTEPLQTQAQL